MRRYFGGVVQLPPGMWPCAPTGPIVHVLNGDYPEADVSRMSLPGLERLVGALVRCTSQSAAKPKWWPSGLVFSHPLELGLSSERDIKLAFQRLIASCCQFFKSRERPPPSKSQFLRYFRLHAKRARVCESAPPPAAAGAAKLTACVHIPFSSDVGRLMAAREQHAVSDELKMRRLERSEWYTNKAAPRGGEPEFEAAGYKDPGHCHKFKMPKRQQHQKRRSLRNVHFLKRFCRPVSVVLERMDLDKKVNSDKKRQLVVQIRSEDKISCERKREATKILRTSPRLRNL